MHLAFLLGGINMATIIYVDTLDHPGLDAFARLTEAQLRNRKEPEKGIFIAESPKVIERALNGGYEPLSFLMEEKHITGQAQPLLERCPGIPVYTGPSELLSQLTGFPLTRGVLCAMRRPLLPTVEQLCRNAHRVAVLEGIADPTNVGAIFRSAAAMHMDAVLVTPNCCDPLYRRSVRVSMGTVFQIPWTRIPQWPEGGLEQLHTLGFRTVALALTPDAHSIEDPGLHQADKLALLLGTEGDGLARTTIDGCNEAVCIPMSHDVDSLNVAAASAVAFWELRYHQPPLSDM